MTPHTCFGKKVSPSYGILEAKDRGRCNKSFSTRSRLYNLRRRDVIEQNEPKTEGKDTEGVIHRSCLSFPETMGETMPIPSRRIPKPWEKEPDIPAPGIPSDPGDVVPPPEDGGIGC